MRSTRFLRAPTVARMVIAAAVCAPCVASAQTVSGVVRGDRDGAPIPGAIVVLMRDTSKVNATLTADDGSYRLTAPTSGTFGLRVDIVGYRSFVTPPFEVPSSAPVVRDIRFTFERVTLPAIAITASSACARVAGENGDAARLWTEASKALEATRLAQDEGRFTVTLTRYERVLALPDSAVTSSRTSTQSGASENPFVSLPPDSIARFGYRVARNGRDHYFAPDARVLLSDQFVSTHCFGTRRGGVSGTLGLSFRPQRNSPRVDVEGVLWLDSSNAELRTLEYRYTAMPRQATGGGTVEFDRLPNGVRGVRRWVIRMPVLEVRERRLRPDGAVGRFVDTLVTAVQVEGGEAMTGVTAARGAGTTLRGVVFDSTRGVGLAGAVITLEGAGRTVRSDPSGAFAIDSIADAGSYHIRFWHPRLDSLGIAMPRQLVQLRRGEETSLALAIPGAQAIARERCGQRPGGPLHIVTGVVHSGAETIGNATVVALQRTRTPDTTRTLLHSLATVTGENGRFAICGLASDGPIWVTALAGDAWTTPFAVHDSSSATAVDLALPPPSRSDVVQVTATPSRPAAVELSRVSVAGEETQVGGLVLLDDALATVPIQVLVDGRVVTTAAPTGVFVAQRLPEGVHRMQFRVPGYAPVSVALTIRRGEETLLFVTPQKAAVGAIASAGRRAAIDPHLAGFNERRRHGQGYFFDRGDIERKSAATLADVIRGVPGVQLVPTGNGYRYETRASRRFTTRPDSANNKSVKVTPVICEMMIYLDGSPFPVETGSIDAQVRAGFLDAIEVYPDAASVPRQFAGSQSACGVLVLWSRSGG